MLLYFCFIYIGCYINNGVFKMNEQDRKKLRHLKNQLKQVIEEHNELAKKKEQLFNQATELQGALKALKELDVDQPTEGEAT